MYFSRIISISRETGWVKLVPAENYEVSLIENDSNVFYPYLKKGWGSDSY